jgi:hypothetical protein
LKQSPGLRKNAASLIAVSGCDHGKTVILNAYDSRHSANWFDQDQTITGDMV